MKCIPGFLIKNGKQFLKGVCMPGVGTRPRLFIYVWGLLCEGSGGERGSTNSYLKALKNVFILIWKLSVFLIFRFGKFQRSPLWYGFKFSTYLLFNILYTLGFPFFKC